MKGKLRYSSVNSSRLWQRARRLPGPPSPQLLFTHFMLAPCATILPGILEVGKEVVASSLAWTVEEVLDVTARLEELGEAKADWAAPLVWVPEVLHQDFPRSPSVVEGWAKCWARLPESPLLVPIWDWLHGELEIGDETPTQQLLATFKRAIPRPGPARRSPLAPFLTPARPTPPPPSTVTLQPTPPDTVETTRGGTLPPHLPGGAGTHRPVDPPSQGGGDSAVATALQRYSATASVSLRETAPPAAPLAPPSKNSKDLGKGKAKDKPSPNPRHGPMRERLKAAFREIRGVAYGWSARDAGALDWMLDQEPEDDAIVARWRMAIDPGRTSFPPDIANLYELLPPHWNRFVPPQATPEPDATGEPAPERPRGTPEAEAAWADVLADVRESGKRYALSWLDRLTPVRIAAGALELAADDGYFRDWAEEHYGGLLGETAGRTGSLAVRIVVAEPGHFGPDGPRPTPAVPDPPFTPVPPPRLKPVPAPERETAKPRVHVGKRKAAHA